MIICTHCFLASLFCIRVFIVNLTIIIFGTHYVQKVLAYNWDNFKLGAESCDLKALMNTLHN